VYPATRAWLDPGTWHEALASGTVSRTVQLLVEGESEGCARCLHVVLVLVCVHAFCFSVVLRFSFRIVTRFPPVACAAESEEK
jgi:hypothetical protein